MKDKVFLDPNIFDYLSKRGQSFTDSLNKLLEIANFATDVKGLQEILYRYHLIGETQKGYELAMLVRQKCKIFDISEKDLIIQEGLLNRYPNVKPRELLHVAVMLKNNFTELTCSPESNYKEVEEIEIRHVISQVIEL